MNELNRIRNGYAVYRSSVCVCMCVRFVRERSAFSYHCHVCMRYTVTSVLLRVFAYARLQS